MKDILIAFAGSLFILLVFSINAHGICVNVSTANLRTGPGTQYEIGWTVNKYMPFKKIGVSLSGKWYAVEDVDNAVLWIHKSLVTSKIRCAVVNTDAVNLRTGPGVRYEKRFFDPVEKYSCFRMLNRKGTWIRLKDENGNMGWVHRDYLWIQ